MKMKRYFVFLLALMLVLALSGCGECEHQWTVADCVNSSVCDKCGEAGEPALGHDWAEATCDAPETCTRCGITQGSPLEHAFGDWQTEEMEQLRTCSLCNLEERKELDVYAQFLQLLTGHWDTYSMTIMNWTFTPHQLESGLGHTLDYTGGDSFLYTAGHFPVRLTLVEMNYDPQQKLYSGYAQADYGEKFFLSLEDRELDDILHILPETQKNILNDVSLCQYNTSRSIMEGTWAAVKNGVVYELSLNPDGTFAANLGGETTGLWQPMPGDEDGGPNIGGCRLTYMKNGKEAVSHGNAMCENADYSNTAAIEEASVMHMDLSKDITGLTFQKMIRDDDLDTMKAAAEEGKTTVVGTWNVISRELEEGRDTAVESDLSYSLTVREDGSFTMHMDWGIDGRWVFDRVSLVNGKPEYRYLFSYPAGTKGGESVIISAENGEMAFSYKQAEARFQLTLAKSAA